ncbi:odorant receptor 98a-like [Drosophila mauritiana]|uniref:Odorant receptor n=1 Tax=Drosophila mauritiana TaxID=7226 RepID=A0A6P8KR73_DROMA|nr:odorant receptor 98a-like [Drosophila mauritiana]
MLFRYLRKPIPQDLLTSPEALRYFEYGMFWMGLMAPPRNQLLYHIISAMLMAWCLVYLPIGIIITCVKDINTFNPSELLTVLQLFFNSLGTPIKVLFFKMHFWRFLKARSLLSEMDKRCTDIGERFVVHRWVVHCNRAYLIYQCIYICYIIFTFLSATISGVPPWRIYNPFVDWRESRSNFWKAILNETLLMLFSVSQTLLTDIYALIYGFMLRAHINLLKDRVEKLCTNPERKDEENQEDLVECIKDHQLIQEFAKMIHPVIARTIFTQFLLIGICLGLSIINLLFFADFFTGLATVVYINGLMIQTFPFCFVCDLIKSDCAHLEMAIFHSNWLNASKTYKLSLIFFLHNSQNSIAFTAGSIFPISTSSNIQVAKLAFSVVTFVNQLNIAERLTKN